MKILLFICLLFSSVAFAEESEPSFSRNINSLWLRGNKDAVLAIANARLQANGNDIAGLILKLQYEIAFFDISNFKTSIDRFIAVGDTITATNFMTLYPSVKLHLQYLQQNIPEYTANEISLESAKGEIIGKPMELYDILKAADLDGLIQ